MGQVSRMGLVPFLNFWITCCQMFAVNVACVYGEHPFPTSSYEPCSCRPYTDTAALVGVVVTGVTVILLLIRAVFVVVVL